MAAGAARHAASSETQESIPHIDSSSLRAVCGIVLDAKLRTGETKGRREHACAPEGHCAVFLLARIRHWNRDRGCERAQLVEHPVDSFGYGGPAFEAEIEPTSSRDVRAATAPPDSLQFLKPCVRSHTNGISRTVKLAQHGGE
jgi:hypothetical protein